MSLDAVHLDGWIARADDEPIDHDEVLDALIAFCEDHGWTWGGISEETAWTEGTE